MNASIIVVNVTKGASLGAVTVDDNRLATECLDDDDYPGNPTVEISYIILGARSRAERHVPRAKLMKLILAGSTEYHLLLM